MRRLLGLLLGLAGVTALASVVWAQAAAQTPAAVLPGQAVGTFHLGQDLDTVMTALGPIHSVDTMASGGLVGYFWPLRRIGAIADKTTHKVVALAVSLDDSFKTDKGIAIGTEMKAVRNAYGSEDSVDEHDDDATLVYDKLGVAFVVDKDGALGNRVSVIFIFTPGHYRDVFAPAAGEPTVPRAPG